MKEVLLSVDIYQNMLFRYFINRNIQSFNDLEMIIRNFYITFTGIFISILFYLLVLTNPKKILILLIPVHSTHKYVMHLELRFWIKTLK